MKKDYVYRVGKMKMSTNGMADTMYALLITKSFLTSHYVLGSGYTRKQSSTFFCDIIVYIHPDKIQQLQDMTAIYLQEVPKIELR